MSWRIDLKTAARGALSDLSQPTAIVEMVLHKVRSAERNREDVSTRIGTYRDVSSALEWLMFCQKQCMRGWRG
jgi:hypothetical protein